MFAVFFKVLLKFISSIIGIILTPIDLIVSNAFPTLTSYITTFNNKYGVVKSTITPYIRYIIHLIPPGIFSAIMFYLYVLVAIYTATISIHMIIKVFKIIKNIKIW